MSNGSKRGFGIIRLIITLLIVAVIGFGGWIGLSFKKVSDLFSQASNAYTQVQSSVEAQDYSSALVYARTAASLTSQASTELQGVQWEIASKIPVLGEDAGIMRSLGSVSGNLADGAVLPVLDAWDTLAKEGVVVNGSLDTSKVQEKLDQVIGLADTIKSADTVVNECNAQLSVLPTSHFDVLNQWVTQLRTTVASADTALNQLSGIANLVTGTASLFSSITSSV